MLIVRRFLGILRRREGGASCLVAIITATPQQRLAISFVSDGITATSPFGHVILAKAGSTFYHIEVIQHAIYPPKASSLRIIARHDLFSIYHRGFSEYLQRNTYIGREATLDGVIIPIEGIRRKLKGEGKEGKSETKYLIHIYHRHHLLAHIRTRPIQEGRQARYRRSGRRTTACHNKRWLLLLALLSTGYTHMLRI